MRRNALGAMALIALLVSVSLRLPQAVAESDQKNVSEESGKKVFAPDQQVERAYGLPGLLGEPQFWEYGDIGDVPPEWMEEEPIADVRPDADVGWTGAALPGLPGEPQFWEYGDIGDVPPEWMEEAETVTEAPPSPMPTSPATRPVSGPRQLTCRVIGTKRVIKDTYAHFGTRAEDIYHYDQWGVTFELSNPTDSDLYFDRSSTTATEQYTSGNASIGLPRRANPKSGLAAHGRAQFTVRVNVPTDPRIPAKDRRGIYRFVQQGKDMNRNPLEFECFWRSKPSVAR